MESVLLCGADSDADRTTRAGVDVCRQNLPGSCTVASKSGYAEWIARRR